MKRKKDLFRPTQIMTYVSLVLTILIVIACGNKHFVVTEKSPATTIKIEQVDAIEYAGWYRDNRARTYEPAKGWEDIKSWVPSEVKFVPTLKKTEDGFDFLLSWNYEKPTEKDVMLLFNVYAETGASCDNPASGYDYSHPTENVGPHVYEAYIEDKGLKAGVVRCYYVFNRVDSYTPGAPRKFNALLFYRRFRIDLTSFK